MSAVVVEAKICSSLATRDDSGMRLRDWLCNQSTDFTESGQLYFYTRIRSPVSITIEHRWIRNGVVTQTINLDVTANNGLGYRTYSTSTFSPSMAGEWRVEVRAGSQEILWADEFKVLP